MDEEPANLLRTAPIRRQVDQSLTAFIVSHADDLRARRIAGERAEDILPLVAQMLGRPIKLVTFASLLSRHVPIEPKPPHSGLKFEQAPKQPIKAANQPALRQRAREPPARSKDAVPPIPDNHTEQPGIARAIKPNLFIAHETRTKGNNS
ncbi:hypothetical protein [Rhabdaerophilum sp. SD176]|uniref:hypothetical protein n=1 Tax=Rhabdaerophilum sp. SD176 TaxID=2983548 RepID=UPI0024DF7BD5|nr:hypothetical protein [Rhabdaerophilum sp. SD176]